MSNFYDEILEWAAKCSNPLCSSAWITITYQKSYDVIEFCILQAILKIKNRILKITVTINSAEKVFKLNDIETCSLLDETFGSNSSSIKFQPKEYGPLATNVGFNAIHIFAHDEKAPEHNYEKFEDAAKLESGAT
ncbi:DgyrCDS14904 [Dimorphilus gyrociliatus]|uniref:DgyrCDS14904 n=1 Tax=Dimorphilus gyrociliatus TaxID=2664684 RepID=A0A7I8WFH1_9ANNE|nr:DgyrCDS14904 [Dimorphilus gyrociliatus]